MYGFRRPRAQIAWPLFVAVAKNGLSEGMEPSALMRRIFPSALLSDWELAGVAGALGSWGRAARLLGAAEMLYDLSNRVPLPPWQLEPEKIAAACREGPSKVAPGPPSGPSPTGRLTSGQ